MARAMHDTALEVPYSFGDSPQVGLVMGSRSDWPTMAHAAQILLELEIPFMAEVVSAHRTPKRLMAYGQEARTRGLQVIVAGAGGAAHLPGMLAAVTSLPVLGVPVQSRALSGQDSLLSIVQMPKGVPVGTLAIGTAGAANGALLAARILSLLDTKLLSRLDAWHAAQTASVPQTPVDGRLP